MRTRASGIAPVLIGSLIPGAVLLVAAFSKSLSGGLSEEVIAWSGYGGCATA